uniref:Uncharacterized protein n=1 Tax=Pithovirus LCDPAC02 TaxID=2506601 RepID=A0A481YPF0_9VIRU|nr:MAG: hypothetical protein LCDPAC02_03300 [Pithovirus LCDPAC02]
MNHFKILEKNILDVDVLNDIYCFSGEKKHYISDKELNESELKKLIDMGYFQSKYYCANLQHVKYIGKKDIYGKQYNSFKLQFLSLYKAVFTVFKFLNEEIKINLTMQYMLFVTHMAFEYGISISNDIINIVKLNEPSYVLYKIGKTLYRLEINYLLIVPIDSLRNFKTNFGSYANEDFIVKFLLTESLFEFEKERGHSEDYLFLEKFSKIISYEEYINKYDKNFTFGNIFELLFENENIKKIYKELIELKYDNEECE